MSKETGKWLPYNLNNGKHECREKQEDDTKLNGAMKKIETANQRKQITLEMVTKKLESIGIIINLERLMKE